MKGGVLPQIEQNALRCEKLKLIGVMDAEVAIYMSNQTTVATNASSRTKTLLPRRLAPRAMSPA